MNKTGIEWTDATWNPTRGCTRVSPGCTNCWAERQAARFSGVWPGGGDEGVEAGPFISFAETTEQGPRWTGRVEFIESKLTEPLRWRKPRRIFVDSMSDLFHEGLPDEAIDRVFAVMALCPQHTFYVLTKRAERMEPWLRGAEDRIRGVIQRLIESAYQRKHGGRLTIWAERGSLVTQWPLPNVRLGVSVEDQQRADERVPHLMKVAEMGWETMVSAEPLLGSIDLDGFDRWPQFDHRPTYEYYRTFLKSQGIESNGKSVKVREGVGWVIIGGESGPGARPCELAWIRNLRDQAKAAGVPCFIKQAGSRPRDTAPAGWAEHVTYTRADPAGCAHIMDIRLRHPRGGDPAEWPEDLCVREWPR